MSPHAVPLPSTRDLIFKELEQFSVSRNAFLPGKCPPSVLSDSYYHPWEVIAQVLPALIDADLVRDAVLELPCLSTDRLRGEPEWRRAYVLLAFFTHAYIWGGDEPEQVLPPQITVPFLEVSSHLELPPILTYAAANLWNFTSPTSDFTDIDSLSTLVSFTGTESESWFLLISVAIEATAASIIPTVMEALGAIKTRQLPTVTRALDKLRRCIDEVDHLLERMYERCDPMVFYHRIRPFLAGTMNMEAAGLPDGVFYDEGDGRGEWRRLRGGSNGQSSLIQFFDIILGVNHTSHGAAGQKSYHDEVREYMPGPHARFLTHVARSGSIRELAMSSSVAATEEEQELRDAYAAATEALSQFRNKHIQIVAKYIILPSKQPWDGSGKMRTNLASSCCAASMKRREQQEEEREEVGKDGLVGTGGTPLVPFLKMSRDETVEAGKMRRIFCTA